MAIFSLLLPEQNNQRSTTYPKGYPKVVTSTFEIEDPFFCLLQVVRVNDYDPTSVDQLCWRRLLPNRTTKPLFQREQVGVGPLTFNKRVTQQLD